MVTVAPGQNSAAPQSERGAVLPTPPPEAPPAEANRSVLISKTDTPSPDLPVTDPQGMAQRAPDPGSNPSEPGAERRLTQIVGEARNLEAVQDQDTTLATADVPAFSELPVSHDPRESRDSVALPDGDALPKAAFLTNAERAQAITAYETAQNLTESGRVLLELSGDAAPPELQAA